MSQQATAIDTLLSGIRVMPVVVIEDTALAVPLAKALLAGGIGAIEVTLRSAAALDAAKRIADEVPDMILGTGTVLEPEDLYKSAAVGAKFAVSPGLTPDLVDAAHKMADELPLLPGVATASEVMGALDHGFERLKLFPAEAVGGLKLIKSFSSPLARAKFCPTGGISEKTAPDYLSQDNVFCVGGSWLAPKTALAAGDWDEVTALAKAAASL